MRKIKLTFVIAIFTTIASFGQSHTETYDQLIKLAQNQIKSNNLDSASIFFKSALNKDTTKVEAYYGLGYIVEKTCYGQGNSFETAIVTNVGACKEAINYFLKAYKIDSTYRSQDYNLAVCYHEMRDDRNALKHIELSIIKDPTDSDCYGKRAEIKYALGDAKGSCKDIKKCKEMGGKVSDWVMDKFCD